MAKLRPITEEERVILHLKKGEAKHVQARAISIPWSARAGLAVFDARGGARLQEIELPTGLEKMPDVVFYQYGDEPAFLAQRFNERRVKKWTLVDQLGVDSASLTLTPRTGEGGIVVDICDDGSYDLYVARDEVGVNVAWVVVLHGTHQDDWDPPKPKPLSQRMKVFASIRVPYMLAARRPPQNGFGSTAKATGVSRKKTNHNDTRWSERLIGSGYGPDSARVYEVDRVHYPVYRPLFERIGLPEPAQVLRVLAAQGHDVADVNPTNWELMARVMEAVAMETNGILFRVDEKDALTLLDFRSS